jgi:hypothetical protein
MEEMLTLKRYAAFMCESYDSAGGWHDFYKSFDTIDDAKKGIEAKIVEEGYYYGSCHVIDLTNGEEVAFRMLEYYFGQPPEDVNSDEKNVDGWIHSSVFDNFTWFKDSESYEDLRDE